jgi:hypothetical protein
MDMNMDMDNFVVNTNTFINNLSINTTDTLDVENLKPNKRIFYFAANPTKNPKNVVNNIEAYKGLRNSGVAMSSSEGVARISIQCPQVYVNEDGNIYPRHFHFMYLDGKRGKPRLHTRHVTC